MPLAGAIQPAHGFQDTSIACLSRIADQYQLINVILTLHAPRVRQLEILTTHALMLARFLRTKAVQELTFLHPAWEMDAIG